MLTTVLGEFEVFVRNLVKLFQTSDPVTVSVVVLGAALLGILIGRIIWKRSPRVSADPSISEVDRVKIENLDRLASALDGAGEELWQFHKTNVPVQYINQIVDSGLKVITFANLKGGVGKTTMAANIAAYFAEQGCSTLLIDFDYQGSLSATVLRAAGRQETFSEADKILTGNLGAEGIVDPMRQLTGRMSGLAIIPAEYELNRQENRMLMRWLLLLDKSDPRFALAKLLADPIVARQYNLVVIDTPPRLSLGTINAFCASTHFVITTILDGASIANVGGLIGQTRNWFRNNLNPRVELAGIVGTMTAKQNLDDNERASRLTVEQGAIEHWGSRGLSIEEIASMEDWPDQAYVFQRNIPDRARFHADAGRDIAYLDQLNANATLRGLIAELGSQLSKRLNL